MKMLEIDEIENWLDVQKIKPMIAERILEM